MIRVLIFLAVLASCCRAQTTDGMIDALAAETAGLAQVNAVLEHVGAEELVAVVSRKIASDPRFAPGTRAADLAIEALTKAKDAQGTYRISNPEQARLLGEALDWGAASTKHAVLASVPRIDGELRDRIAPRVVELAFESDPGIAGSAMEAIVKGSLPVHAQHEPRIRDLALATDPTNPVWQGASRLDAEFHKGGPENPKSMVSGLRAISVAVYLCSFPSSDDAWNEVGQFQGARAASATGGVLRACYQLAKTGKLNDEVVTKAASTLATLSKQPETVPILECCLLPPLGASLDHKVPDRAAMAKTVLLFLSQCTTCPDALKKQANEVVARAGLGQLVDDAAE